MEELTKKIQLLERTLNREKAARKQAENILEKKSTELYDLSKALKSTNNRLEELLSEKTSELQGVFVNIIDAYVVMDFQGNVLKMNDAAVKLLGFDIKKEKVNLIKLVKKEYIEYSRNSFKQLLFTGTFSNYRIVIITKNKEEKIVQINASLIYNKEGKPIGAQGIARDITEEVNLKNLLEEQKRQLHTIVDHSPIGIALYEVKNLKIIMANNAICKMLGYSENELASLDMNSLVHPDDNATTEKYRSKLYNKEINTFILENRYFTKAGLILWTKTSVTAVKDDADEIKHLVITMEDITEEKLAKEMLKESENRLSTLIVNLQTGILLEDENRKVLLTNNRFCNMFGINTPPEKLKGTDRKLALEQSQVLFSNPKKFIDRINQLLLNKKVTLGDELELKDGRIFERNYIPIYYDGKYRGHLWSYDDITLKKELPEKPALAKEKYSNIIANMNLGLVEVNKKDVILFANQSFCEMSGYSLNELKGRIASELLLMPESEQVFKEHNSQRNDGISDSYEIKVRIKSGKKRYWLISGAPSYDMNGNIIGSIGIHLDITQQKKLESQKEKLLKNLGIQNEQLNEYAHIVSHDLKSPLRNISALLSWTMEDFREKLGDKSLMNLQLMQEKVEKMDYLIDNILKYSSIEKGNISNKNIDLNKMVAGIIEMIFIPENITVTIKKELPEIIADETRIQQLFQNLISNAVNYTDKEIGKVEIDYSENESHFIFSVKDNGIGIAKEHHEKIFKIFSSLGTYEKSTGIGLNIVKKVVDLYEGKVWLESEPGIGTTFFFSLKK